VKHEKKELGNVVLNDVKFQSKPSLSCFTHDVTMIAALRCRNGPQRSPPLHIFLISCDVGTIIGANVFNLLLLVACLPACLCTAAQLEDQERRGQRTAIGERRPVESTDQSSSIFAERYNCPFIAALPASTI
jgi:hypothetical protein